MVFVYFVFVMIAIRLAARRTSLPKLAWPWSKQLLESLRYTALVGLPLAFWALIAVSREQARSDGPRAMWFRELPIPLVDILLPVDPAVHAKISAAVIALTIFMTAALIVVCSTPIQGKAMKIAVGVCGCALAVLALRATVITTTDPYYYVVVAREGAAAYTQQTALSGAANADAVERLIPNRGCIYGPLWVDVNRLVQSFGGTVGEKIRALRIFNALLFVGCILSLKALRVDSRALVAFALNPMLWFYFVLNAHIDLMGLLPCFLALIAAPASAAAAALLVAAAACIKLPFLLVGIPAFARIRGLSQRVLAIGATAVVALGASWLFAGEAYFGALTMITHKFGASFGAFGDVFVAITELTAVALLALAFFRGRFVPAASLLTSYVTPIFFPWYYAWSLPYAAASTSRALLLTLLALPIVALLADGTYDTIALGEGIFVLTGTLCILDMIHANFGARRFAVRPFPRPRIGETTSPTDP